MTSTLKNTKFSTSFKLPREEGTKRIVMSKNSRTKGGKKQVFVAPYAEGRLHVSLGTWVDWDTEVTVVD